RALHDQATRRQWFLLVLIVAAAFALRIWGERESMFIDEIASVHFARVPIATLWSDWMVRETNPPLFYALLGLWTDAVGDSDFAMRILPIIFSCAGIVLIFLLGTRLFNVTTGLTAAALTAVSAQNVFFGQQVRGYSLGYTASLAVFLACVMLRISIVGVSESAFLRRGACSSFRTWWRFTATQPFSCFRCSRTSGCSGR
ncbi:MAG: hypothetical protein JWN07_2509, partial [Hyphomicrobiales bacterium]|nr:hypothetical protein [Hyphomicrobiales bacterium]